jgi:hypothetical protein
MAEEGIFIGIPFLSWDSIASYNQVFITQIFPVYYWKSWLSLVIYIYRSQIWSYLRMLFDLLWVHQQFCIEIYEWKRVHYKSNGILK